MTTTTLTHESGKAPPYQRRGKKHRLLHHIHLRLTENNVAVVTFDRPDKSANIFDEATLDELNLAINAVISLKATGVTFVSSKPNVFVAGADLNALVSATPEELERLIDKGQKTFNRIAELPIPTVAAIHGACLGGGLEMALACDSRIATNDRATRVGLPETMLGIIPAWGGSTRLPRLIGLPGAMRMILTGKSLDAGAAWKAGVVDVVVPRERLEETARWLIAGHGRRINKYRCTNNRVSASFSRQLAKQKVLKRTRGNYPAQLEAIEVVTRAVRGDLYRSLEREKDAVLRLAKTPEARNLMRVYMLSERARKFRYDDSVDASELRPVTRVAVIGAGVMGSGIAQWVSARERPVILEDVSVEKVAGGMKMVGDLYKSAVKRKIFTKLEAGHRRDLVSPSAEPVPLHHCDIVVEAAVENMDVKKKIFADLCGRSDKDTILATNTSALSVTELSEAEGITHPERIVGLHFFNPVSRMKLVEVAVTKYTSPEVVERTLSFVRGIGKIPVVVKDSPGFLVNRILMPYLIGAGKLVDLGCPPHEVDESMLDYGMPMGPMRLLDEIGLDIAAHVAKTMKEHFGDRFEEPKILEYFVEKGRLGRKTDCGFYCYENGEVVENGDKDYPGCTMTGPRIAEQLVGLMAEEARMCLKEGIVESADDIDLAMILGSGFAPFRGGPLRDTETRE